MRAHPANERILAYLGADDERLTPFHGLGFDQGGVALFEEYGHDLPEACKWSLGTANVMVHPTTGVIFAVHRGRFTFLLRRANAPAARRESVETLDGFIDVSSLDADWWVFWFDDDDIAELHRAHERAGRE